MSTLLVIQGYAAAQARIDRHWPWYLKADCDILGIDRTDAKVNWPQERLIGTASIGVNGYPPSNDLPSLLLDSLELCLQQVERYDDFCCIEHDSIFVRRLARVPALSAAVPVLVTTRGGGYDGPDFVGKAYYHTPWWVNRRAAADFVEWGRRMLKLGLREHNFPDRFVGLMVNLHQPYVIEGPFFSVNHIDSPAYVEAARKAIADGCQYVHGIKTAAELARVVDGLVSI